jgi:hypothetical protein
MANPARALTMILEQVSSTRECRHKANLASNQSSKFPNNPNSSALAQTQAVVRLPILLMMSARSMVEATV